MLERDINRTASFRPAAFDLKPELARSNEEQTFPTQIPTGKVQRPPLRWCDISNSVSPNIAQIWSLEVVLPIGVMDVSMHWSQGAEINGHLADERMIR